MDHPAIRTVGLTKRYGAVVGVEDLSIEVAAGEVFGFLGAKRWVIDVHGPLGPVLAVTAALPVDDVEVAPFALEDAILHLLGDR